MLVTIRRLSTRNAPDGTWAHGDLQQCSPELAGHLIRAGLAELVEGERAQPDHYERATLDAGEKPERSIAYLKPRASLDGGE